MKKVAILIIFTVLFSACSHDNGFSRFQFTTQAQRWENNQVYVTIHDKNETKGTITAVYLNNVMPELYKKAEYFFIALYQKQAGQPIHFTLNDAPALLIQKVDKEHEPYGHLIPYTTKWSQLYFVEFKERKNSDILQLGISKTSGTSDKMIFKKGE